jgi:hypothetical protein
MAAAPFLHLTRKETKSKLTATHAFSQTQYRPTQAKSESLISPPAMAAP